MIMSTAPSRPVMPVVLALLATVAVSAAGASFWQISTHADFLKGDGEAIAIDTSGRVTLGAAVTPLGDPESPALWRALVVGDAVYAGSGSDGKVFRFGPDGKPALFFDAQELQVHALAAGPDQAVYAGTSPDGKVYRIEPGGASRVVFDPDERYVWALAVAPDGSLLVGTGEKGAIYRVAPDGSARRIYAAKSTHVTTLATLPDGSLVAGTDTPGQVLKLSGEGRAFVLLDTPFREIRALRVRPDGHLLVAAMNGRAASESRLPATVPAGEPQPTATLSPTPVPSVTTEVVITAIGDASTAATPTGRTDAKKDVRAALYDVAPDGLWDTVWESADDLPYDVVPDGDAVIVATGNKGKVFRVEPGSPRVTLLARVPAQQVTSAHRAASGDLLLVTANPGKVFRAGGASAARGHYDSDVLDAGTTATWGTLRWVASTPPGTSVALKTRSGNTARPDDTWSEWSAEGTTAAGFPIRSPKARYLQWRAVLAGTPGVTPVLTSVTAAYQPRNIRPQVTSITVHPPGTAFLRPYSSGDTEIAGFEPGTSDGRNLTAVGAVAPATTQPMLGRKTYQRGLQTFVWKAEDANDDRLQYDVAYRREGETTWRPLKKQTWDAMLTWDTTSVPDGTYTLRISASDAPANGLASALVGELESASFSIDNSPPRIELRAPRVEGGRTRLAFVVRDAVSPIQRVEYSRDALRWQSVSPVDGIVDAPVESFDVLLEEGVTAADVIIRALDALGNVVTAAANGPVTATGRSAPPEQ
jgi:hypothetical protein